MTRVVLGLVEVGSPLGDRANESRPAGTVAFVAVLAFDAHLMKDSVGRRLLLELRLASVCEYTRLHFQVCEATFGQNRSSVVPFQHGFKLSGFGSQLDE